MRLWGKCNDRFVKISRFMPHRNAKQISHHWRNYLNPNLCKQPLGYDEKIYVIELARKYRTSNNTINWKYVIKDLKIRFGKLYAENQVKNYWIRDLEVTRVTITIPLYDFLLWELIMYLNLTNLLE
ncbi:hypothetical protein GLOIN_2v461622 [Rhizophagus clarus]|uniref:HTH myb-type domain-containing protein n=1 Tax=Rhizophagus clarus TaxID=94130 RepID=A0A8H3R4C4_9GLOM|nr:hypothetical protein GLOIN_2v461622 [Rhizophagus clarus]